MPLYIIRQDITKMDTDAIVNAANTRLMQGGGVCGAIFKAAGAKELQAACDKLAPIQTGGAAITPGFALPAKYIIHAAGPVYDDKIKDGCRRQLRSAYTESLKLAAQNGCESIAFPLISSGIYGYPKDRALKDAVDAIKEYLEHGDMDVYLIVFDKQAFKASGQLFGEIESYIDENYADERAYKKREFLEADKLAWLKAGKHAPPMAQFASVANALNLDNRVNNLDEPFSDMLLKLIDSKGKTDVEVYKKANIDRKHFSKIRTGKGYTPRKPTILALAVALELTKEETDELLKRAGYALSHADKSDVIVEYFLVNGRHDIFEINEALFYYDLPLLGS